MTINVQEEYFVMLDQMVQKCREEITDSLAKLLSFSTVSGSKDPEEERASANEFSRAFSWLGSLARSMNLKWRNYDNRICVIEQPGGNDGVIGLPLHVDVVPSGDGWHYPAFGGMVENDIIYGRGAQDDKGPIIQMLYAIHCLNRLKLPFRRTVRLIIASQEETGVWSDVDFYLEKEPAPDMCIVADAEFPIGNGEKGLVDVKIDIHWENREAPSKPLQFRRISGGERSNVVPNRGEIIWEVTGSQAQGVSQSFKEYLKDFMKKHPGTDAFPLRMDRDPESQAKHLHITFLGKSAHGSKPEKGHNAVLDALLFYSTLPEQAPWISKTCKFLHESFSDLRGEKIGVDENHPFIGDTTINLGVLDIDADKASLVLNIRPTLGRPIPELVERIRKHVSDWAAKQGLRADVKIQGKAYEPLFLDPEEYPELIGALKTAFQRVTGKKPELTSSSGTTFAKAFPNSLCFGPILTPEEPSQMHQADEHLKIEDLLRNTKIYGYSLMLLACQLPS
ncbi:MAG: Sapep family Mn(2+)-dependent dipeptidase [Candidatus Sumerlaeia bacterium]